MNRSWLLMFLGAVAIIVIIGTIYLQKVGNLPGSIIPTPTTTPAASPIINQINPPPPISSASPVPTNPPNTANIVVTTPQANATLSLPIIIKGQARVFENQFNYRVRDADGTILTEDGAYANSPDAGTFGNFTITVSSIAEPNGTNGTIEVFDYSPKDGSEIDKVSIPIHFNKENNTTLQIYFGSNQQSGGLICQNVFPVLRSTVKTQTPATIAINELLAGPTKSEQMHGYFTSINSGVKLQKLTIVNGVATTDFNEALEEGVGGSCRVAAIRAQITQTLMQFPTVHSVVISINGRTEDILQP